jgi:two-component system, chemotaxis family, CheB/CheR fusion protein
MTNDTSLDAVLQHLKGTRGFDFTGYKRASLERRVGKRMEEIGIDSHAGYLDHLELHPEEFAFLFNTILINVTSFFRDAPTWDYLADEIVPRLVEAVPAEGTIRAWCAGCASGEEPYTLAIVLAEALGEEEYAKRVKIFATDVDEQALDDARHATYTAKAVEAVPERLRDRYFERLEHRYAFRKDLRRTVIFGRNDLVQDAPISRVDLLICRNTLMYFNAETQGGILGRFHFALNNWGYLYLGRSEMLVTHSDLFKPVSLKRRVFSKVGRPTLRDRLLFTSPAINVDVAAEPGSAVRESAFDAAPVAQIAVDADGALILANDQARSLFALTIADLGRPLKDLEVSYRPVDLRSNMEMAHAEARSVALSRVVMTTATGQARELDVHIAPLYSGDRALGTTVTYNDVTAQRRLQSELEGSKAELEKAYEELESTVEELETTNEELHSTNEELETTNEELHSTNEELETMNEELQSSNEELETMNDEMRQRTLEIDEVNEFMEIILTSMGVAVAVLDPALTIRVWNAFSTDLWGLRADEAEGENLLGLDFGLPTERLKAPLRDVMRNGAERIELVVDATNRRGRGMECRVVAVPLKADGNGATGAILLMEDVSGPAAT